MGSNYQRSPKSIPAKVLDQIPALPFNHEAEQAVLGCIIVEGLAEDSILDELTEDYFYSQETRACYTAILKLARAKEPINLVTVKDEMKQSGDLDINLYVFMSSLASEKLSYSRENTESYIRILRDYYNKRKLYTLGGEVQDASLNGLGPVDIKAKILKRLEELPIYPNKGKELVESKVVYSASEFLKRDIKKREAIIDTLLFIKSLAMVYGYRGRGKTFFLLFLGLMIALARKFLCWSVPQARNVLYIDGEMAVDDLFERVKLLIGAEPPDNFFMLASEDFYKESGRYMNLNLISDQEWVRSRLDEFKIEVLILDNLSSLTNSPEPNSENLNDEEPFLVWCRQLRHEGFTVIFAHHSGKNQEQRGKSKREDFLDLSINLAEPSSPAIDGARFRLEFSKVRGKMPKPAALECELVEDESGLLTFTFGDAVRELDALSACLLFIHQHQPQMQMDIVNSLNISKYQVSRALKKARDKGLMEGLELTEKGRDFAVKISAISGVKS